MDDVEWDAEDFEPVEVIKTAGTDKWEGEDEDDLIKDAWDDDEEGEDGKEKEDAPKAVEKKKKKNIKDIIAEKEAKKKDELLVKAKELEEKDKVVSPEEAMAEKLQKQQMQEEADLKLAKETFGLPSNEGGIDSMYPVSKEEFDTFGQALKEKITRHENSGHYVAFLEDLFREVSLSLEVEDIKRLGSVLNALQNEKMKQQKAVKGKKKAKKGPSLVVGKAGTLDDVADDSYDVYDDFM